MPSDESKGSQLDAIGSLAQRQIDNTDHGPADLGDLDGEQVGRSNGFPMGGEKRAPRRPLSSLRRGLDAVFPQNICEDPSLCPWKRKWRNLPMWKSIRTTNALENLNREFRRRTKTQASFTTEESAVALRLLPLARFSYDASMATNICPGFLLAVRSPLDLIP